MMRDELIGRYIGKYRIEASLGGGGQARVYKAYHPALDTYVAIKIMPPYFAAEEGFVERFTQEARVIARLRHPNIVTIHDFGEEHGLIYIVMEFVAGGTLADRLQRPIPFDRVLPIVDQIGRALDYAHSQGIIHRDVKPSNVLMAREDWVLLSDFGIAKVMEATARLTRTGLGIGTPEYMSPEQGQGMPVDGRSDIYSLGIILYEMFTAQVPFRAETPFSVVLKHMTEVPTPPRVHNPSIPPAVEAVIAKALAKQPSERFSTAGELVRALAEAGQARVAAPPKKGMGLAPTPPALQKEKPRTPTPPPLQPQARQDAETVISAAGGKMEPSTVISGTPVSPPQVRKTKAGTAIAWPPLALPFSPVLLMVPVLALLLIGGGIVLATRSPSTAQVPSTVAVVVNLTTPTVGASPTVPAATSTLRAAVGLTTQTAQASFTPTAMPSSTAAPPTPTVPAPTATVPAASASPAPAPARPTPTRRPAATAAPGQPSVSYPAPVLLEPADGTSTGGGHLTLRWRWDRSLGPDEHFDVRVFREGAPHNGVAWTEKPEYTLNTDQLGEGKWLWSVAVVRGSGGKLEAVLSPESGMSSFIRTGGPSGDGGGGSGPKPLPTR